MWYIKLAIGLLMRTVLEYEFKDYLAQIKQKGVKVIMTNPVKNAKPGGVALSVAGIIFFGNELAATLQQLSGVSHPTEMNVYALLVIIGMAALWAVLQTALHIFGVKGIEKQVADEVGGDLISKVTGGKFHPVDTTLDTPVAQVNVQTVTPVPQAQVTPQVQSDVYVDEQGNQLNPLPTIVPTTPAQ